MMKIWLSSNELLIVNKYGLIFYGYNNKNE